MTSALTLRWADVAAPVATLGPGRRAVLWVQGCTLSCVGCASPHWLDRGGGTVDPVEEVADRLLELDARHHLDGLTLSGGEPLQQADALAGLWTLLRATRPDWTLVLFTGYRLRELDREATAAARALVDTADLVISGRYVPALNDGVGLRGSSNQRLTTRRPDWRELVSTAATAPRELELHLRPDHALFVGVPRPQALDQMRSLDSNSGGRS